MNRLSLTPFMTLLATFMCVLLASWMLVLAVSRPPASKGLWVYINITGFGLYSEGLQIHTSDEQLHRAFKPSHIPPELRR